MKALTIRQPWADAIVLGPKQVENRTWALPARYEGARILIHAGSQPARLDDDFDPGGPFGRMFLLLRRKFGPRGKVLAIATITGCHWSTDGLCCAPWGFANAYHWTLTDVVALPEPVPARGALNFWTVDEAIVNAALRQDTGVAW